MLTVSSVVVYHRDGSSSISTSTTRFLYHPSKLWGSSRRLNGSRNSIGIGSLDGRLTGALCVVDR
jgi:hypothetical protein